MNITLEDYRECLKNDVDLPSYRFYVSRINFILEQENVDFQYFVNNLAYYKYKYKYLETPNFTAVSALQCILPSNKQLLIGSPENRRSFNIS